MASSGKPTLRSLALAIGAVTALSGVSLPATAAPRVTADRPPTSMVAAGGERSGVDALTAGQTPTDVASFGHTVYIADATDNVIRALDATTGKETVVAGTGTPGFSGDDGKATSARLNQPAGVAVDRSGNLFIADTDNNRIREVAHSNGAITTVAGTGKSGYNGDHRGTATQLRQPHGLEVGAEGEVYIADTFNNRVRELGPDGKVTTVAGTGTPDYSGDGGPADKAALNTPYTLTLDAKGDIFVADTQNNRVREVTAADGKIATVAGNGWPRYTGDGEKATMAQLQFPDGIAVEPNGDLLISDMSNYEVRRVDHATGKMARAAGQATKNGFAGDGGDATNAKVYLPEGIAVDGSGGYYFADRGNHRVRHVAAGGTITTVAGNGTEHNAGDNEAADTAQLNAPTGLAVDAGGRLLIADRFNNAVRAVDGAGKIATVAGTGVAGSSDHGVATEAGLDKPQGVASGPSGTTYVADTVNDRVVSVSADGTLNPLAGTGKPGFGGDGSSAGSAQLDQPQAVAADSSGRVYIADTANNAVRMVDTHSPTQNRISTVVGGPRGQGPVELKGGLAKPAGLAIAPDGTLLVADSGHDRIVSVSDGHAKVLGTGGLKLDNPTAVATDAAGDVFVADSGHDRVVELRSGHAAKSLLEGHVTDPRGLAVGDGVLYVSDTGANRVVTTEAGGDVKPATPGTGPTGKDLPALPVPKEAPAPAVHVKGNKFVDAKGRTIRLLGADRMGQEYQCLSTDQVFDGPIDANSIKRMRSWGLNTIRLPLNEDCWLGINGTRPEASGATYRKAVEAYVHRLNKAGIVAVLDLHWGAPGDTEATFQGPMPDADHTPTFWSQVAKTFRGDDSVVLDLYNEPYGVSWDCWLKGCVTQGASNKVDQGTVNTWPVAGMQSLVDSVRTAGFHGVLMLGGMQYANDTSGFLSHVPNDPDHQISLSYHLYDWNVCATESCWNSRLAPIAAKYPVLTGEMGQNGYDNNFTGRFEDWSDQHGLSYLQWAWNPGGDLGLTTSFQTGAPTTTGLGLMNHIAAARVEGTEDHTD
ncbi:cellulase family glycosylhydrolase [Streptomyces sp. NPDC051322]|uniref:NHL domain-containing protein n=1 Tax=Streptomyces sp. NPDC051322 TaxID=3154645 RepID=UPI00344DCF77